MASGLQGKTHFARVISRKKDDALALSPLPPHHIRLQHRIDHAVRRGRHAEFAADFGDLAAEPGQLQPVAALEVERHRGLHVGRHLPDQFENFFQRIGWQRDALGAGDIGGFWQAEAK